MDWECLSSSIMAACAWTGGPSWAPGMKHRRTSIQAVLKQTWRQKMHYNYIMRPVSHPVPNHLQLQQGSADSASTVDNPEYKAARTILLDRTSHVSSLGSQCSLTRMHRSAWLSPAPTYTGITKTVVVRSAHNKEWRLLICLANTLWVTAWVTGYRTHYMTRAHSSCTKESDVKCRNSAYGVTTSYENPTSDSQRPSLWQSIVKTRKYD